jgi:peptidoglycan/LPS O-acetylase OafA/YrhL
MDIGAHWADAWGGFPRVTFSFFMGVAMFRVHRAYPVRLPSWVLIPICLILAASFLPAVPLQGAYDAVATVLIFPALLFLGAAVTPPVALRGTCKFLGAISYSIYVLHVPIRNVVLAILHYVPVAPSWWLGAAFMVLVIAAAWVADKIYDIPVRRWLSGRFRIEGRPRAVIKE